MEDEVADIVLRHGVYIDGICDVVVVLTCRMLAETPVRRA